MPTIYRVMRPSDDDHPRIGSTATTLGVRVPKDIPSADGWVQPETGGMSVSPTLRLLPPFLIPKRLRSFVPDANGRDMDRVWMMGDGPFSVGEISANLVLRPDAPDHGTVQPAGPMTLDAYTEALAATRDHRAIDESGDDRWP